MTSLLLHFIVDLHSFLINISVSRSRHTFLSFSLAHVIVRALICECTTFSAQTLKYVYLFVSRESLCIYVYMYICVSMNVCVCVSVYYSWAARRKIRRSVASVDVFDLSLTSSGHWSAHFAHAYGKNSFVRFKLLHSFFPYYFILIQYNFVLSEVLLKNDMYNR